MPGNKRRPLHGRQLIAPTDRDKLFGFWLTGCYSGQYTAPSEELQLDEEKKVVELMWEENGQRGELGDEKSKEARRIAQSCQDISHARSLFFSPFYLSMRVCVVLGRYRYSVFSNRRSLLPALLRSLSRPSLRTICHSTVDDDAKEKNSFYIKSF